METYLLKPTESHPYIYFNPEIELLELKGNATMVNAREVFFELFTALDVFKKSLYHLLTVNIEMGYFNTSTYKCLLQTVIILQDLKSGGKEVEINWFYNIEDEDALEQGEDLMELSGMPLNFVAI